jgi:hypothetical protein
MDDWIYIPANSGYGTEELLNTAVATYGVNYLGQFTGFFGWDSEPNLSPPRVINTRTVYTEWMTVWAVTVAGGEGVPALTLNYFSYGSSYPNPQPQSMIDAAQYQNRTNVYIQENRPKRREIYGQVLRTDSEFYYKFKIPLPTFKDFLSGYQLDTRLIPSILFIQGNSPPVTIGFYRRNLLEQANGLTTIYWDEKTYPTQLAGRTIDISGCVLTTFYFSHINLISVPEGNYYNINELHADIVKRQQLRSNWQQQHRNLYPYVSPLHKYITTNIETSVMSATSDVYPEVLTAASRYSFATYGDLSKLSNLSIDDYIMDSPRIIDTLTISQNNQTALTALKVTIDAIKTKVDSLTATDTSSLATSTALASVKNQLNLVEQSVNLLKVEIL